MTPATTASRRNGSWVYQRVAPTRRMMPTSVRLVNADTWTVLEISSSAATAWMSATANVRFRTPLSASKNRRGTRSGRRPSPRPTRPAKVWMMTSGRSGSTSLTLNDAGSASGRASFTSSGCDSKICLNRS